MTSRRFYYGWTIVAVAFLSLGTWLAMRTTFAIFMMALLDEFHWSRAATAGVQSVSFIVYTCSAPFVGMLIDRFGPRRVIPPGIIVLCAGLLLSGRVHSLGQLYFFYGGIAAFGVTFISISPYSAVLSRWFQKKRGLASGIAVSGMGFGTFVFVPLTQYVIGGAGWRTAFTVLSGCVFILLFPLTVMLMRRNPQEMGLSVDGTGAFEGKRRGVEVVDAAWAGTDWTLKLAAREGRFWSLLIYSFLVICPMYMIIIHGPQLLVDSGFARMDVAIMVAIMGVATSRLPDILGVAIRQGRTGGNVHPRRPGSYSRRFSPASCRIGARPGGLSFCHPFRRRVGRYGPHVHGHCGRPLPGEILRPHLRRSRGDDRRRVRPRTLGGGPYLRPHRQLPYSPPRRNRCVRRIMPVCLGCGAEEGAPADSGRIDLQEVSLA